MAAQQVDLQRAKRVPGDSRLGQRAEARIDAVDRRVAERLTVDDRPRRVHARHGLGREPDDGVVVGDGQEVVEGQAGAG